MSRFAKAALSFSLFMALGAAQASAQTGFCLSEVRNLNLDPAVLGPGFTIVYNDDGGGQISCVDCQDTAAITFFLGMNDDREQGLRDGTLTADGLTENCLKTGPNCSARTFVEGASVGYWLENRFLDKVQHRYSLYNDGKVMTVRGTAALTERERISTATETVFRSIERQMHCAS